LLEAFLAGGAGHAGIHIGIFVRLAGDGGLEIVGGRADRLAGCRVTDLLEELEMAVRVAGLTLGSGAEYGGDVVVALDVGLLREIEVAAVGLALAGEGGLEIFYGLRRFQGWHRSLSQEIKTRGSGDRRRGDCSSAVRQLYDAA